MEAKELRIGNLVNVEGVEKPVKIVVIDTTETSTMTKAKPIPLTEDWLLKLGANKVSDRIVFDRFMLTYFESYKYWYVTDLETDCYLTKVEFVHEWQNFVFVMNGKELKINK